MKLNNETLEAIRNRRYQLRPVRKNSVQKKRRLSESAWDVRMGDIAQILSRRYAFDWSMCTIQPYDWLPGSPWVIPPSKRTQSVSRASTASGIKHLAIESFELV